MKQKKLLQALTPFPASEVQGPFDICSYIDATSLSLLPQRRLLASPISSTTIDVDTNNLRYKDIAGLLSMMERTSTVESNADT
jgi:hypothetical protein